MVRIKHLRAVGVAGAWGAVRTLLQMIAATEVPGHRISTRDSGYIYRARYMADRFLLYMDEPFDLDPSTFERGGSAIDDIEVEGT